MVEIVSPDFGPCEIPESHIDDICTFLGLSRNECISRLQGHRIAFMTEDWRKANPQTPDEIRDFYAGTENYIWELSLWHYSLSYKPYLAATSNATELARRPGPGRKALDYGCGIGTAAVLLSEAGFEVDICDIPGRTLAFAVHRLSRRGLRCNAIPILGDVTRFTGAYDLVVSIDVLEHTPHPDRILQRIIRPLRPGGLAVMTAAFEESDEHPYHLAEVARRFAEGRWYLELTRHGLKPIGWSTYRKVSAHWLPFFELRYRVWRHAGVYVQHDPSAGLVIRRDADASAQP